jgi:hypothetical protein
MVFHASRGHEQIACASLCCCLRSRTAAHSRPNSHGRRRVDRRTARGALPRTRARFAAWVDRGTRLSSSSRVQPFVQPYLSRRSHYGGPLLPRVSNALGEDPKTLGEDFPDYNTRGSTTGDASHEKETFPEWQISSTRGSLSRVPCSLSGTI